jgi:hypothetical protein
MQSNCRMLQRHPAVLTFSTLFSVEQPSIAVENEPQRTLRGKAATEAARATAEYAKNAKAGREPLFISFSAYLAYSAV